jgi:ADP-ribose pyrophosphatase YjhB (NUDIX family)
MTNNLINESWYEKPAGISEQTASGGVVVRLDDGQIYLALIREDGGDEFVLPKGRVEAGESIEQAAHREIQEEAGLADLQLLAPLGIRERLNFSKKHWKITHYFLFLTVQREGKPTDLSKEFELQWFPLDRLPTFFWPEQKEIVEINRDRIIELVRENTD